MTNALPNPFMSASVIQIWDDNHEERAGFYRAFWCRSADDTCGSPIVGYCSPGGSHRTVKACVADAARRYPHDDIYRNGRLLYTAREDA